MPLSRTRSTDRNAIFIGGTVGNDTISVKPGSTKGTLQIDVTEANLDKYRYSGATGLANIARLIVFGGDGNDILQIASNVTLPSVLDGGAWQRWTRRRRRQ